MHACAVSGIPFSVIYILTRMLCTRLFFMWERFRENQSYFSKRNWVTAAIKWLDCMQWRRGGESHEYWMMFFAQVRNTLSRKLISEQQGMFYHVFKSQRGRPPISLWAFPLSVSLFVAGIIADHRDSLIRVCDVKTERKSGGGLGCRALHHCQSWRSSFYISALP